MNDEEAFCSRPPKGSLVIPRTPYQGTVSLGVSSEGRLSRCLTPDQSWELHGADGDRVVICSSIFYKSPVDHVFSDCVCFLKAGEIILYLGLL